MSDHVIDEDGECRIVYDDRRRLFFVGPDGSRWKVHPETTIQFRSQGKVTVNTDFGELIEEGGEREE